MPAIQNNPVNKQEPTVLKTAAKGAVIGAAIKGGSEMLSEKLIFKNSDTFVKQIDKGMLQAKKAIISENGFIGEAVDKGIQKINEGARQAKEFITAGKYDFQQVGRQAAKGALRFGVIFGAVALAGAAIKGIAASKKAE